MEHHNYDFKEVIGKGGMSTVYLGEHKTLLKPVAIKVLNIEYINNLNIRKRFLDEARNMFSMSHHNIVRSTDLIDQETMVAFVMEYVHGKTIKQLLDEKEKLSNQEIESIFKQILNAVGYIHMQGLVHRDIKPSNFMLNENLELKLMDFGIAKDTNIDNSDYTNTALNMGTTMYMSPEQIRSTKDVTAQSDIYSLGVLLWQMISGIKPYEIDTLSTFDIQVKIVNEPLNLTNTIWDEIIQKATEKNLVHRFKNCAEFLSAFENLNVKTESISTIKVQIPEISIEKEINILSEYQIEDKIFRCIDVKESGVNKYSIINKKGDWLTNYFFDFFDKYEIGKNKDYYLFKIKDKWGLIRKDGEIVVQPIFDAINLNNKKYAGVLINELWGVINYKGEWILQPKFQKINNIYEKFSEVVLNGKCGVIDFNNKWIVEPINNYLYVYYSSKSNSYFFEVLLNKKFGLKNQNGDTILPEIYDNIDADYDSDEFIELEINEKIGISDYKGNVIFQPKYDELQSIKLIYENNEESSHLIIAKKNLKFGIINIKEVEILPFIYDDLTHIDTENKKNLITDLFIAKHNGLAGVMNLKGEWFLPPNYEEIEFNYCSKSFFVKRNNLWGLVDIENNWILQNIYTNKSIIYANNGLIPILEKNDKWGCINEKNEFFIQPIFDEKPYSDGWDTFPFANDYAIVKINGKYGCINIKGEITLACEYDNPEDIIISSDMLILKENEKIGFVNLKTGGTIYPIYDDYQGWYGDYTVVTINEKFGVIDKIGNWKISPNFDFLSIGDYENKSLNYNLIVAKQNNKVGYIDFNGNWVIFPIYDDGEQFEADGFAKVIINEKIGFIDIKGNWLIQPKFDVIEIEEDEDEEETEDEWEGNEDEYEENNALANFDPREYFSQLTGIFSSTYIAPNIPQEKLNKFASFFNVNFIKNCDFYVFHEENDKGFGFSVVKNKALNAWFILVNLEKISDGYCLNNVADCKNIEKLYLEDTKFIPYIFIEYRDPTDKKLKYVNFSIGVTGKIKQAILKMWNENFI